MERKQLAPGVFITTLDASKFNRCRITIHLRFPALRQSATDTAVLPLVLERGYAACPDMTALSRRLAQLYGADLGVDLSSAGTDRVLSADICGIKDAYALAGENLTDAYADIVFGTIFDQTADFGKTGYPTRVTVQPHAWEWEGTSVPEDPVLAIMLETSNPGRASRSIYGQRYPSLMAASESRASQDWMYCRYFSRSSLSLCLYFFVWPL